MKKDVARFSSSAGKCVPGSTDGQWKRFNANSSSQPSTTQSSTTQPSTSQSNSNTSTTGHNSSATTPSTSDQNSNAASDQNNASTSAQTGNNSGRQQPARTSRKPPLLFPCSDYSVWDRWGRLVQGA